MLWGIEMSEIARLEETVDRFSRFIETIPASALSEQEWGPKEVLAHLVYHHELYVRLVEACVSGLPVAPPTGRFRELNSGAVAASRGQAVGVLLDRLQKANRRLAELYRQHDPGKIWVEIKAGAKPRPLAGLVPEVEAHIRSHLEKLRKEQKARA